MDTINIVIFFPFYILSTSTAASCTSLLYKESWSISTISESIFPTTYTQEGVKYFVLFFFVKQTAVVIILQVMQVILMERFHR